jgi:DNA-binding beta-propeller fold protein YncE
LTSNPEGIAIDSANNIWVLNDNTETVSELDGNGNALSPANGFTAGGLIRTVRFGIAIDRSGNVWIGATPSMTEFLVLRQCRLPPAAQKTSRASVVTQPSNA